MHRIMLSLTFLAALGGMAPASAAWMWTGWEEVQGQDMCIDILANGMPALGFRPNVTGDRQTVFGWRGEDGIAVRCIGDRGLAAIFVHTSTTSAEVNQLGEAVRNMLRNQGRGGKF